MSRRSGWSRRQLLAGSSILPLASLPKAQAAPLAYTSSLYESIGVRPFINCKGTFTILTGSQTLPEVKQAMLEASRHYVHLDELAEAVGQRLAELTKAEWGMVSAGCAAAITHATAACLAGSDPEKMQRLPKLDGMKNRVVMPKYSRNVYDHAARMTGATIVEVDSEESLRSALGPDAAMVLILSCPAAERGPLRIENTCKIARERNVPVLVDAAAETLTIPNHHLGRGANLVAYSGGKCLRGPQAGGLLLGQKNLVQAAWINSAPHHAFGRSSKVGKEEMMGTLAAVEMWVKRDHKAEWAEWESWLATIRDRACSVEGVTSTMLQPEDLSNHAPQLRLSWDGARLGITGEEVRQALDAGKPRIILAGSTGRRSRSMASSVTIMPYMMNPGEDKIVAAALYNVLAKPPKAQPLTAGAQDPVKVAGTWTVQIAYRLGSAQHSVVLNQSGSELSGTHHGAYLAGPVKGEVHGSEVEFSSVLPYEGTTLDYTFQGRAAGDRMEGEVSLGEYGTARWTAHRA